MRDTFPPTCGFYQFHAFREVPPIPDHFGILCLGGSMLLPLFGGWAKEVAVGGANRISFGGCAWPCGEPIAQVPPLEKFAVLGAPACFNSPNPFLNPLVCCTSVRLQSKTCRFRPQACFRSHAAPPIRTLQVGIHNFSCFRLPRASAPSSSRSFMVV